MQKTHGLVEKGHFDWYLSEFDKCHEITNFRQYLKELKQEYGKELYVSNSSGNFINHGLYGPSSGHDFCRIRFSTNWWNHFFNRKTD